MADAQGTGEENGRGRGLRGGGQPLTSGCWSHDTHRAWVSLNAWCVTKDVSVRMMRDGWEAQTGSVTPASEEDRRGGGRRGVPDQDRTTT